MSRSWNYRASQVATVLASWTVVAVVVIGNRALSDSAHDCAHGGAWQHFVHLLQVEAPTYLVWALVTGLILWQAARLYIGPRTLSSLALHGLICGTIVGLVGFVRAGAHNLFMHTSDTRHPWGEWWSDRLLGGIHVDLTIYAATLAIGIAIHGFRVAREQEVAIAEAGRRASRLETQVAEARLQALRMQLQPHFLFNALNTVSSFTVSDPAAARDTLARLSTLLREVLETSDQPEIPLARELRLVRSYLEIESARFGDRIESRVECPRELESALVPTLLLQPLVENALRHGLSRSDVPATVEVLADATDGTLRLRVVDNGVGFETGPTGQGVGLSNTRRRLAEMFSEAAHFSLRRRTPGGTIAEVQMPLRFQATSDEADSRGLTARWPMEGQLGA